MNTTHYPARDEHNTAARAVSVAEVPTLSRTHPARQPATDSRAPARTRRRRERYPRPAGFDSGRRPPPLRTTANRKRVSGIAAARPPAISPPQSRRLRHCARRHYRRDRPANGHIRPTSRKRFSGNDRPGHGKGMHGWTGFDSGRRAHEPETYFRFRPDQPPQSRRYRPGHVAGGNGYARCLRPRVRDDGPASPPRLDAASLPDERPLAKHAFDAPTVRHHPDTLPVRLVIAPLTFVPRPSPCPWTARHTRPRARHRAHVR